MGKSRLETSPKFCILHLFDLCDQIPGSHRLCGCYSTNRCTATCSLRIHVRAISKKLAIVPKQAVHTAFLLDRHGSFSPSRHSMFAHFFSDSLGRRNRLFVVDVVVVASLLVAPGKTKTRKYRIPLVGSVNGRNILSDQPILKSNMSQRFLSRPTSPYFPRWAKERKPPQQQSQQLQERQGYYNQDRSQYLQRPEVNNNEAVIVFDENKSSLFDAPFATGYDNDSDDENLSVKMCPSMVSDITGLTYFHQNHRNKDKLRDMLLPAVKAVKRAQPVKSKPLKQIAYPSPKHNPYPSLDDRKGDDCGEVLQLVTARQNNTSSCLQPTTIRQTKSSSCLQPTTISQYNSSTCSLAPPGLSQKAAMRLAASKKEKKAMKQQQQQQRQQAQRPHASLSPNRATKSTNIPSHHAAVSPNRAVTPSHNAYASPGRAITSPRHGSVSPNRAVTQSHNAYVSPSRAITPSHQSYVSPNRAIKSKEAQSGRMQKQQHSAEPITSGRRLLAERKKKMTSPGHTRHVGRVTSSCHPTIAQMPLKKNGYGSSSSTSSVSGDIVIHKIDPVKCDVLSVHSAEKRPVMLEMASCRLLSATVLPIQRLARQFLARLNAERRFMAVTVLQAHARRCLVRCHLRLQVRAATKIQAVFRGHWARDQWAWQKMAATVIQSAYRGFVGFCEYQCDILDIITVQSVCRRKLAKRRVNKVKWDMAAPLIQKGLEIMGIPCYNNMAATELAVPSEDMLLQMAALMSSLRVPLEGYRNFH